MSGLQSRIKEGDTEEPCLAPVLSRSCLWGQPPAQGCWDTGQGTGLPVNPPLGMKKVRLQPKEFCGFGASSGVILAIRTDFNLKKIMYTIYIYVCMCLCIFNVVTFWRKK